MEDIKQAVDRITANVEEVIIGQFGRVRDVVQGPDGCFYLALQNPTGSGTGWPLSASTPGRVIRLAPAGSGGFEKK